MPEKPQSYASHAKWDPLFHFFAFPVALINVGVAIAYLIRTPNYSLLWFLVLSAAFAATVFMTRVNSLKVQDRVIRLEETLRMRSLLPVSQHGLIEQLHRGHFIALRFAPDSELPGLVEQTVANKWGPKDIKGAIKTWRADHFRV
jgi:hypothetical protein